MGLLEFFASVYAQKQLKSVDRHRTVRVSSDFLVSSDVIWEKLQKLETLQYIAAPYASFIPLDKKRALIWHEGETLRFKLKLFGFISVGVHTIRVQTFDRASLTIQTYEGNNTVQTWNHKITLEQVSDGNLRYTDEVEICAGRLTLPVFLWSECFYRHRQRKWRKLLKRECNRK